MRLVLAARLMVLVLGLTLLGSMGVLADDEWYLAQDDFILTYAVPNNPGSAGSTFIADGRLMPWGSNTVTYWFDINGSTALGAQSVGSQWVTDYAGSVLSLYADNLGVPGALVWQGTATRLITIVNKDGSLFPANDPPFDRPAYATDPSNFNSVGDAMFVRTGGTWTAAEIYLPWLGTYNWNYVYDPANGDQVKQKGNMQGKLTIPEPMSLILGSLGLMAVGGFRRLRGK